MPGAGGIADCARLTTAFHTRSMRIRGKTAARTSPNGKP